LPLACSFPFLCSVRHCDELATKQSSLAIVLWRSQ
jgi:hypothetical protein